MNKKYAVIFAGPSGAGKTTVADALIAKTGLHSMSRSATTRAPRGDGRDDEYIYLTREEFEAALSEGDVLEHTLYGGNMYGTRRVEIERILGEGKIPVLVLDMNGVDSLKTAKLPYPVISLYLYNDLDVIEHRLTVREAVSASSDKLAAIKKRCDINREDYLSLPERCVNFDRFIKNGDLEECVLDVMNTIDSLLDGVSFKAETEIIASKLKDQASK